MPFQFERERLSMVLQGERKHLAMPLKAERKRLMMMSLQAEREHLAMPLTAEMKHLIVPLNTERTEHLSMLSHSERQRLSMLHQSGKNALFKHISSVWLEVDVAMIEPRNWKQRAFFQLVLYWQLLFSFVFQTYVLYSAAC